MTFRGICFGLLLSFLFVPGSAREIRNVKGQRFEFYPAPFGEMVLFIDSQGYLWMGTENGIIQFDGYDYRYTKENPMDSTGYRARVVYSIAEDHEGGIWVGTNLGVNYKAKGRTQFINFPLGSRPVFSIAEDQQHQLWLSQGDTLVRFSIESGPSALVRFPVADPDIVIHKLFLTGQGVLLGLGPGCYELRSTGQGSLSLLPLFEGRDFMDICQGKDSNLFIASRTMIYVLDKNLNLISRKEADIPSAGIRLHEDRSGLLWVGTDRGCTKMELDANMDTLSTEFYPLGQIDDIVEDRSGNLFFAQQGDGVYKLGWNHNQYTYISLPPGFEDAYAFKFLEDVKGNYWIGTYAGLLLYAPESRTYKIFRPERGNPLSIPDASIYSIFEDTDKMIWIGTGKGLVRYNADNESFTRLGVKNLSHHIVQSADGRIWFISDDIIYSLDPRNLKVTSHEYIQGKKEVISQVFIDRDNVLWGWNLFEGLKNYSMDRDGPVPLGKVLHRVRAAPEWINWLTEDGLGRLWISEQTGVYVLDKNSGELVNYFNSANSQLQQDAVWEMIRDRSGLIWLKQDAHGSISIDPRNFNFIGFNPAWLYNTKRMDYSCINAAGRDGKLFTEGTGDFCIFYPDSTRINRVPPDVVLEEQTVNNHSLKASNPKLRYNENNIIFKYCGIQLDNPEKNRYAYFLEGYDRNWVEAGFLRQALYSSLPPGKYHFQVKACNSDGVWSDPVQLSSLTILPPWWRSPLAIIIYIILIAFILFLVYTMQLRRRVALAEVSKLNEIDEFKNRFFTNISHEFRTPLTVISGLAGDLKGKQGKLIRRNADRILTLVNQILDLSKLEAGSLNLKNEQAEIISLSRYITYSFSSLMEEKSLEVRFSEGTVSIPAWIDTEKYTIILQNLLSNAIKFTPEKGSIFVEITRSKDRFMLIVSDTGTGISPADLPKIFDRYYQGDNQPSDRIGTGIGLALTRQFAELMGGSIEVSSLPGQGTSFAVDLPTGIPETVRSKYREAPDDTGAVATTGGPEAEEGKEAGSEPGASREADGMGEADVEDDLIQILLVEDNPDVCIVIRDLLKENYEVFTAGNGEDGIAMALNNIPDIIISDIKMPGKDGLELAQTLKRDPRTSHIPIILLTAKADIQSRLEGLSFGADVYLQKPFNNKELLLNVQNLLNLREAVRAKYRNADSGPAETLTPEDKFIASVRDLIYQKLSDDTYGIERICRDVGVSRTQLHRKLKALTGKSVSIFVRDLRLAEGRHRIRRGTETVAEVAYSTGFKDPNYFTRLYTEKYGYPPSREMEHDS